jgi:hypothetical protein
MQADIRRRYEEVLDASHHGRPQIVQTIRTGTRGRPRIHIDPDFLRWAYSQRSTSGIGRFLNVGRTTIRNALLNLGIAEPQQNPFAGSTESDNEVPGNNLEPGDLVEDHLLDPELPHPAQLPDELLPSSAPISFTGPVSSLPDDALDEVITHLRSHFRRAGISMLDGMLRRLGHRVPRERIRNSLMRIDPVQRVFQRIRIRRRVYSVPGPNALWHHDGQHGMSTRYIANSMDIYGIYRSYPVGYCNTWFH